jgi:nucleotide-binding universal stress UspA family protein
LIGCRSYNLKNADKMPVRLKKILYTTNLKDPAYNALEGLLEIKKIGLEEIILLSISPPKELKGKFHDNGINLRELNGPGPFITKILDSASKENVSLIACHLEREGKTLFGGSPLKQLVKNTHLPILFINNKDLDTSGKGIFDTVLFATDWSQIVQNTLDYILGLKEIIGVLDIVNVLNQKPTIKDIRLLKDKTEEIRKICLKENIDAESHIYAGKTAEEILLAAEEYYATVIIMGAGSKNYIKGIFSGSVTCEVAEKSPVPVLVVP